MPIPSSSTNEIESFKCKNVSSETVKIQCESDHAMETDVSMDKNKQQASLQTTKKKALLLHARREDDDRSVNLTEERLCPIAVSGLYAGSRYHGTQKCGNASYEVNVELLVNMCCKQQKQTLICYFFFSFSMWI